MLALVAGGRSPGPRFVIAGAAIAAVMVVGCARAQPVSGGDLEGSADAPEAQVHRDGAAARPGLDGSSLDSAGAAADPESRPARMRRSYLVAPPAKESGDPALRWAAAPGPWPQPAPSAGSRSTGAAPAVPADGADSALGLEVSGGGKSSLLEARSDAGAAQGLARVYQGDEGDSKQPAGQGGGPAPAGSAQGVEYTWADGDRTQRVYLQTDLVALPGGEIGSASDAAAKSGDGSGGLPVFSTESGSLMTLPGGVLVMLDPQWDRARVEAFFERNDIERVRVSELDYAPNGFFVETDAGFPSLSLANLLAAQDGVVLSSPNWWTEAVAK